MNAVLEAREPSARYLLALQPPLLGQFDLIAQAPNGIARLRELILTLAVQGKLVPQDPDDEPASALLERIRSEKSRLVKEGKIRKEKPLAEIAEEEKPFALPADWEWVRLAAVANLENGDRGSNYPSKPDFVASGVRFINAGHLRNQRVDNSEMNYITPDKFSLLRSGKIKRGDILYCLRGSLGKTALVDDDNPGAIASSLVIVRICNGLSSDYALLYLASPLAVKLIRRFDNGTAQPNLGANDLAKFVLPLPPLAEQSRIVARVEELMALCDALEAKGKLEAEQHARLVGSLFESLANSESPHALAENWQRIATHFDLLLDRPAAVDALEQTILQLAVRGLLVPQNPAEEPASTLLQKIRAEKDRLIATGQLKREKHLPPISDEEKPFELPESWEWTRLGTIADIASNLVSPEQHQDMLQVAPDCIEKATGCLLERRTVKDAGVTSPNHRFHPGQILYSKIRPSLSKAVVVDFEGLCSADMYPLNSWIDTGYLHRYILSQPFLEQVRTAENRVKMPKLNQEALNSFLVPVPPLAEQFRIVARLADLRALCAELSEHIAASAQTRSRLAEALIEKAVA